MEQHYTQLTEGERYHIHALLQAGFKLTRISKELGRNKSTISREIKRNSGQRGYRPKQAHEKSVERKNNCANGAKFTQEQWDAVDELLQMRLSPAQISGRLKNEKMIGISHESIYQHVYKDKANGGKLHHNLRGKKKYKKRYGSGYDKRGKIKNRKVIDERPAIVDQKIRVGDWEGDLVVGKNHKGAIVTLTERVSKFELAAPVPGKQSKCVADTIIALLEPHKDHCYTITFDNGKEFSEHERIAATISAEVYFAHPYHSWERGLNENTNGLLRQYFPKKENLDTITYEQVQKAVNEMNHRPRKALGFKTPYEVFFGVDLVYINTPQFVALRV
jgi:IS30 family transposase